MKIIITTLQPADPMAVRNGLSDAGLHNVAVIMISKERLQVTCRDDEFSQALAAMTHDRRIKAAVICARNISGRIHDLTLRSCA